MGDSDLQYGIPLLKAWWTLSSEEMTNRALIASEKRRGAGRASFVPGNPWRYERFSYPEEVEREGWASWESQQADPLTAAEANRQNAWLPISLALGERLRDGTITAYGRNGHIAGNWTAIPKLAWSLLRVPFDHSFTGWKLGHLTGGGAEFWGVRLRDSVGLPMRTALIAYGSNDRGALVQRLRAYSQAARDCLLDQSDLEAGQVAQAERALCTELIEQLKDGRLIATGTRLDGTRLRLSPDECSRAKLDFGQSSAQTHSTLFTDVLIRVSAIASSDGVQDSERSPREWRNEDVAVWWRARVAQHPSDRWPYSEKDDWDSALGLFPGVGREIVRSFRIDISDRIGQGRRPKSGNPPKKSAAQI